MGKHDESQEAKWAEKKAKKAEKKEQKRAAKEARKRRKQLRKELRQQKREQEREARRQEKHYSQYEPEEDDISPRQNRRERNLSTPKRLVLPDSPEKMAKASSDVFFKNPLK
ncbi:expressed unknown protein [Seminavis robusta]|uniref:Uncharacterized protein n=1 Tax=Seminavis robusta TaxID=568900 RepID=A0A9N8EFC9_9STRA|nr:expressed unknown protein [Seminavis robusta]|eukprot:Sro1101_g241480.1 n/a (112) ;mRNA; f:32786-33121